MARIGNRQVAELDLGVIVAGVLMLVFSFLDWFGDGYGFNAWESGFFAYTGAELAIIAGAIAAAEAFTQFRFPRFASATTGVIIFALSALAAVSVLLKALIGYHDQTREIGLWLALVATIAQAVLAYLAFSARGERLPGLQR